MVELIETNPEILGGKPVIKGTRIPVSLIFELLSLNYSVDQIIKEYPSLSKEIILDLIKLGKDALELLQKVNLKHYLEEEPV
jgi:uncharacterized protein (DUF433 family)